MSKDKQAKYTRRSERTRGMENRKSAVTKAQNEQAPITLGDKVSLELSPYDLSSGRVTYRFKEGTRQLSEVTIEDFDELYTAVKECVAAVTRAHEQIEKNRLEVEALGRETRKLLSELKAA